MEKKLKIPDGGLFNLASESASTSASSESESTGASKLKITRGSGKQSRSTVTYRIKTETVDRINNVALDARRSINETVQMLLDYALDNAEIE